MGTLFCTTLQSSKLKYRREYFKRDAVGGASAGGFGCAGGGASAGRFSCAAALTFKFYLRQFKKYIKNYWKAQKWRKVSAGYMICATFAPAQNWRKISASYVVGLFAVLCPEIRPELSKILQFVNLTNCSFFRSLFNFVGLHS